MSNATALHEVSRGLGTYSTRDERGAPEPRVDLRVPLAEQQLHWWFTVAESVLGLRGSGFESSGGPAVWDAQRIHDAHMGMRSIRHRTAMGDVARIGPLVAQLSVRHRSYAALTFAPRRWSIVRPQTDLASRADVPSPDALGALTGRAGRPGCLAGLCLLTPACMRAWVALERSRKHPDREPTPTDLLEFLRDIPQSQKPERIRPMALQAEAMLGEAVGAFEVLRRDAAEQAERARANHLARLRAGEGP